MGVLLSNKVKQHGYGCQRYFLLVSSCIGEVILCWRMTRLPDLLTESIALAKCPLSAQPCASATVLPVFVFFLTYYFSCANASWYREAGQRAELEHQRPHKKQ